MPSANSLVAFAALSVALVIVPGPSVMFVVGRAVALGKRSTLLTVCGNTAGLYTQVVMVALGLGVIVERSAAMFTAVKLTGAVYLIWLGLQAIRHRHRASNVLSPGLPIKSKQAVVLDGFVVGFANPKTIVFFAAILPQFVEPASGSASLQMATLGLVFAGVALVLDSAWGLAAGTARDWFIRSPRRLEQFSVTGGAIMIGLGLRLALSGRERLGDLRSKH